MTTFRKPPATLVTGPLLAGPLLLALVACGSPADSPAVDSIPATGSPAGTGTPSDPGTVAGSDDADTSSRRPALRLDDSADRRTSLWNAYNTCLLDNGASAPTGLTAAKLGDVLVQYPAPDQAQSACRDLEPVQPPELDASTNPHFHRQSLSYVQCLQDNGLWVTLNGDTNIDWTYTDGHPVPENTGEIESDCLIQAFGS
ncbi:hypothetical protein [Nocardioides lijunqiniae]|uniref:hypothetical protein n=1 Tax=Nocardioides lijunqiniae TaxID=2760832 RepID=UPI00187883A6|nr:hypothetical protein [Nocardioides lijunqiniae]